MKYYLIAGEASGDLHASNLMREIKKLDSNADFRFWGGDLMLAQGGEIVCHYRDTAYMGVFEVVKHLPDVFRNLNRCEIDIKEYRPDVIILVDYAGFNLRIAKRVKKMNIPAFYYIAPKIWAWNQSRAKKIKKYVNKVFAILPFETDFYARFNVDAAYSGNPLLDAIDNREHKNESLNSFLQRNNLPAKPIIALLAGSRSEEINRMLPDMISMKQYFDEYQLVVAGAPSFTIDDYKPYIKDNSGIKVLFGETYSLLQHARAAMVTSGTATLEAALLRCPQVVCYKMWGGAFSDFMAKRVFIQVPFISLVNLIMNKEVVKELFQKSFSLEKLKEELNLLCYDEAYRKQMFDNYDKLGRIMGEPGSSRITAELMWKELKILDRQAES